MSLKNCHNCNTPLQGKYCHQCGEKETSPEDLHIKQLLNQATNFIFSLDNKFLKTFKVLLFFPGKLTSFYLEGIRVSYMKPFQIFVIANLFFFLFLAEADIFRTPSKWYFQESQMKEVVEQKITELNINQEVLIAKYDQVSINVSKAGVITLIPFIGIIFWIFNLRKKIPFGGHTLFGLHFFSAFLMLTIFISLIMSFSPIKSKYLFQIPIVLFCLIYLIRAHKVFYNDKIGIAFLKVLFELILFVTLIFLYRKAASFFSFYYFIT